ncbi:transferase, partial [Leptospira sp. 96542]|nr:transferase [Leptospira sp. 96542]
MYLLFPGRHHLLTRYQHEYISMLVREGLSETIDYFGNPLGLKEKVKAIVFAVTSANHNNTRRNPLPLYQRAMMIQEFTRDLKIPCYVAPIDDIGYSEEFADYTIKKIEIETEIKISKDNTIVLCSTPVSTMYFKLGFRILPVEKIPGNSDLFYSKLPWQIIESVSKGEGSIKETDEFLKYVHPASKRLWEDYNILNKVRLLFSDKLIGDDGDITESRDYNTYVREMDTIAELKFTETKDFILPGRIGDIGCAVGSWIKLACAEETYNESDFYGVEIARKLFQICEQRKENGDFDQNNVFFLRKN